MKRSERIFALNFFGGLLLSVILLQILFPGGSLLAHILIGGFVGAIYGNAAIKFFASQSMIDKE